MKHSLRSLTLVTMVCALCALPLATARAYAPPCARGDIYVGGKTLSDATCMERSSLKALRMGAQMMRPIVRAAINPTVRTKQMKIRQIYLHPTAMRAKELGIVKERNVKLRRVEVRTQPVFHTLRPLPTERGMSPGFTRLDRRPWARETKRSKQAVIGQQHMETATKRLQYKRYSEGGMSK